MKNYLVVLKRKKSHISLILAALICITMVQCKPSPKNEISDLQKKFMSPPDEAKPRVWWHWMNGNVTKHGIRKDLEWMKRIGIGGFQNFDVAALLTQQVVESRLVYNTTEWKDAFSFATALADSLGMEMAIAASPGWSESGGPWVKPEEAMKKLVWSELNVEGGKPFFGKLPDPPRTTGPFQNLEYEADTLGIGKNEQTIPKLYDDVAVIAFRIPENSYNSDALLNPNVSSSGGNFSLDMLTDGNLDKTLHLPPKEIGEYAWVQFEFQKPESIRSLTIAGEVKTSYIDGGKSDDVILQAGNDGIHFDKITDIPVNKIGHVTLSFNPVTARFFRFGFKSAPPAMDVLTLLGIEGSLNNMKSAGIEISELVLRKEAMINRFEEKAGYTVAASSRKHKTLPVEKSATISKNDIVDLTAKMNPDGTIAWNPGPGKWKILRFGYSLTGKTNTPAPLEATGFEVDKLNPDHVKSYFNQYLDIYKDATGGLMGKKGLQYLVTDSWEAEAQNWTEKMMDEFKVRRGYDMIPWFPALSGYVVESSEASDKFLWDFRRTLADLVVENHYDLLSTILKERDMGRYTESHEVGRAFIGDGMEVKRNADIPMGATWTPFYGSEMKNGHKMDVKESSSVANIYGQKYVAAESFTAVGNSFSWSPEALKPVADIELANGVNRFIIHTSVHQPLDSLMPGLSLGPVGQWFTRQETWAEQAKPWMDYLARSSYMMQQGKRIADVLYFYGEDNNITSLFADKLPEIPEGYDYDFVNADALINVLKVEKGKIITPGGGNYRILVLDANCRQMTLPVLKKLKEIVAAGAIVIGDKPEETPSLRDDQEEFKSIVDELWREKDGENNIGTGKVIGGKEIKEVLDNRGIAPDFRYSNPNDRKIFYVHRKIGDTDIFWVNNRENEIESIEAYFRVEGKQAEVWNPVTGEIEQASYHIEDGITTVPLLLDPNDAQFVVFRHKAKENSRTISTPVKKKLTTIEGSWRVKFQENRGAPDEIIFDTLKPWNENKIPGIKYFSGTGTYSKSFDAPDEWFKEGAEIWLDLGQVKNLAEVIINGKSQGMLWKSPFKVNISKALNRSENKMEIRVTNLWGNRLIGDAQPDVKEKITYTSLPFYKEDSPLKPSGLIGPVNIFRVSE